MAHLGDHADEGWDLCDTPACQVYRGIGAEHSLSDRAVTETAGLVAVYEGEPIDAMYTSTCGGHTEDSFELFSGRAQPYLRGVPCAWERPMTLAGAEPDGPWIDATAFAATVARKKDFIILSLPENPWFGAPGHRAPRGPMMPLPGAQSQAHVGVRAAGNNRLIKA